MYVDLVDLVVLLESSLNGTCTGRSTDRLHGNNAVKETRTPVEGQSPLHYQHTSMTQNQSK